MCISSRVHLEKAGLPERWLTPSNDRAGWGKPTRPPQAGKGAGEPAHQDNRQEMQVPTTRAPRRTAARLLTPLAGIVNCNRGRQRARRSSPGPETKQSRVHSKSRNCLHKKVAQLRRAYFCGSARSPVTSPEIAPSSPVALKRVTKRFRSSTLWPSTSCWAHTIACSSLAHTNVLRLMKPVFPHDVNVVHVHLSDAGD